MKRYTIDYGLERGYRIAYLWTPYKDWRKRFYTLAGTCFGIRKSIFCSQLIEKKEVPLPNAYPDENERLEFDGDVYVWRKDGARKMVEPEYFADLEWDTDYCEKCKEGRRGWMNRV